MLERLKGLLYKTNVYAWRETPYIQGSFGVRIIRKIQRCDLIYWTRKDRDFWCYTPLELCMYRPVCTRYTRIHITHVIRAFLRSSLWKQHLYPQARKLSLLYCHCVIIIVLIMFYLDLFDKFIFLINEFVFIVNNRITTNKRPKMYLLDVVDQSVSYHEVYTV